MRSSFSNGYLLSKYFSRPARTFGVCSTETAVSPLCPFTVTMRVGMLVPGTGVNSSAPTASASRYDGSGLVRTKVTVFHPSALVSFSAGVLKTISYCEGIVAVSWYGILKPGSSQHGNALRASTASNCVKRYGSSLRTILYKPTARRSWAFEELMGIMGGTAFSGLLGGAARV